MILLFVWYVAVELRRNGALGFPLDDPWIHLTFARNLAQGWGFAYNHGEPVQGSTAPLWTLIIAFFHLFTKSAPAIVWITKLLGALFLWVAAVYACRLTTLLTGSRWAGLAAGLGLATLCHFGWAMVSGMEVTLSIALVLAGLYYYAGRSRNWEAFRPWVLFALAVYTRPESMLIVLLLVIDFIIQRLAFRQRGLFWRGLGVWLLCLVPYSVLNLALVHSLFPQTYVAKVGRTSLFGALASGDGAQLSLLLGREPVAYFRGFVAHLWRGNPVIVLLAVAGLAAVIAETIRRRGGAGFTVPLVALLYAPIVGVTAPYVTPAFQNGRYLGAPVAAAVVLAACGAAWIVERGANQKAVGVEQRARARGPGPARKALAWLVALLVLFNVVTTGIATAANTAGAESSINRMQVALGKWLARNTPPQAVIACNDVGAIGYFAKRRVLDLLGLVTPEVVLYRNRQPVKREYLGAMEFVQDKKPDYLVIFPDWFPNARTAKFLQPVHVVDLPDNTASQWYFEPVVQTRVGILITGLEIRPRRSMTVVYRCDWTQNPP